MTTAESTQSPDAASSATAARCRTYRQFANAFMHPESGHDHHLDDGTWLGRLRSLAQQLPYGDPFASIQAPPLDETIGLGEIYTSNFDVGQGAVSLYGRSYLGGEAKPLFEELFRFYEHFALAFDDGLPEWPDWIVVELEFMHYLSFLEAESSTHASSLALRRAERDFLERQLCEFTVGLAAALKAKAVAPYADLAQLLNGFVSSDLAYLKDAAA